MQAPFSVRCSALQAATGAAAAGCVQVHVRLTGTAARIVYVGDRRRAGHGCRNLTGLGSRGEPTVRRQRTSLAGWTEATCCWINGNCQADGSGYTAAARQIAVAFRTAPIVKVLDSQQRRRSEEHHECRQSALATPTRGGQPAAGVRRLVFLA